MRQSEQSRMKLRTSATIFLMSLFAFNKSLGSLL